MQDLRAADIMSVDAATFDTDQARRERSADRIRAVAFHVTDLLDDAKRLAMRSGVDVTALDKVVHSSLPLRVVANLTNSARHGGVGRQKSVTILNRVLIARPRPPGAPNLGLQTPVVTVDIVDAREGTFASRKILDSAIHHWAQILHSVFEISPAWADRASGEMPGRFGIGDVAQLGRATPIASRQVRRYRRVGPFYPRWDADRLLVIAVQLVLAALFVVAVIWSLVVHGGPSTEKPDRTPVPNQTTPIRSR
jgi:hypothetical protein